MLTNSAELMEVFPNFCTSLLPEVSAHRSALASLLCGQKVTDPDLYERLRQTALLHLFVVSGAHLIELERLLEWLRIPRLARITGAIGFTALSGAQPPLVRALIGLLLPERIFGPRTAWPSHGRSETEVLKVGLLTLAMVPFWIHSMSLALSWACAFSISLPLGQGWRGALRRTLAVWLVLSPLLAPWGLSTPMSWVLNLIIAPVFSAVSLPLALIALAGGRFVEPFDRFMDLFLWLLHQLSDPSLSAKTGEAPPVGWRWLWIGGLHVFTHFIRVTMRRRACAR